MVMGCSSDEGEGVVVFPTPSVKRERSLNGEAKTTMTSVHPQWEGFHKNYVERVKYVARFYIVFAFSEDSFKLRDTNTMTLGVGLSEAPLSLSLRFAKSFSSGVIIKDPEHRLHSLSLIHI